MTRATAAGPPVDDLAFDLASAALALARDFAAGATLWCCSPAWPHHAQHVAVEFVHPVIVGKRALPALAARSPDLAAELRSCVRPGDVVLAVAAADDAAVASTLRRVPGWGARTVWIGAGRRPPRDAADHVLWLDDAVQAPHDGRFILLYHLLWELTQVCLEHPGLVGDGAAPAGEEGTTGASAFLYPFLAGGDRDPAALLADLTRSARDKAAASARLRAATLAHGGEQVRRAAAALAGRFPRGGRLLTFGNGGSATDAAGVAALFSRPPHGPALAARSLAADEAVLTALANDVGFDAVFARQLDAHGRADDVAVGISTSGSSRNVLRAFGRARARGILTVGLAGYGGGEMAACDDLDHCLIVGSDSVHRIQEAQSALAHGLWAGVQHALGTAP